MIEEQNSQKNSPQTHHKYEKFLNDAYACIRQKQLIIKRSCTPDHVDLFPKLSTKQDNFEFTLPEEKSADTFVSSVKSHNKSKKFKNFLNLLDEHQKKISDQNMNMLGLEVKRINYCEKSKRKDRPFVEFFDENVMDKDRSSKTHVKRVRKTIDCEKIQEFPSNKIGMSHRQIITMNKRHSFHGNTAKTFYQQKLKNSKLEGKRKSYSETVNNNPVYDGRINSYRELIFKISFAHDIYTDIQKDQFDDFVFRNQHKYKAWIGSGNNGVLIKNLIKRRFWWNIVDDKASSNFLWTQLKNNQYFKKQQPSQKIKLQEEIFKHHEERKVHKSLAKRKQKAKIPQEEDFYKVFTSDEKAKYKEFMLKHANKYFIEKKQILKLRSVESEGMRVHNHLINNFYLGNKKALFYNLKQYYDLLNANVFKKIPLTFHIKKGFADLQYKRFVAYYKRRQNQIKKVEKEQQQKGREKVKMRNVWIVKPGELTNRGHGITVIDQIYELNHIIKRQTQHENGTVKTFIVQLYLDRPFLYQRRKFDIRHFILVTQLHGIMRAYWYNEGYIRTSSYEFDIQNFDRQIHLTNDAVQKGTSLYGKYEPANKLSYGDFQRYLDATYPKKKYNFQKQILPEMKEISIDAVKSSFLKLSPHKLKHNFEIFGLDFMIDNEFKPWLIQVNTNPCLEISCSLLSKIIPQMIDQSLRLSLDIVFPPPCHYPNTSKHLAPEAKLQNLNFELIFDQKRDGAQIRSLYRKTNSNLLEEIGDISEDEVYEDEGKQIKLDELL